jgi:hypothetical protein
VSSGKRYQNPELSKCLVTLARAMAALSIVSAAKFYSYVESVNAQPRSSFYVTFLYLRKAWRVQALDHKILYLDSQLQKTYTQNKMQRCFCFRDQN